jgi:tetratricopeptide (TPR) repeat protein
MSRKKTIFVAVASGLALIGCTAFETRHAGGVKVAPYEGVSHGGDAAMLYQAGRMFQARGQYAEAILAYRQAVIGDPTNVEAHNGLAVCYSLSGKPDLAEREFHAALALAPDSAHLHNNLGFFLMSEGRLGEALAALERAHALDPRNPGIAANIASVESRLGPHEEVASASAPAETPVDGAFLQSEPVSTASTQGESPTNGAASQAAAVKPPAAPSAVESAPVAATPAQPEANPSREVMPVEPSSTPDVVEPEVQAGIAPAPTSAYAASQLGRYHVEISNGNGASRLAWRTSKLLAPAGIDAVRLTNSKPFGVQQSRVEYVAGAQEAARVISSRLPAQLPLAEVARLERNEKVRVLLGRDFPTATTRVAAAGRKPGA